MKIDERIPANEKYQAALRYQKSGDLIKAEMLFRELLSLYSNNFGLIQLYSYVLSRLGRQAEAIQHLEHAIELQPDNALAYYNLGMAYELNNNEKAANDNLNKALSIEPDFLAAHRALANIQLPYESYMKILKRFHRWLRPMNYVEIGVETGASMSLAEPPTICLGIDPNPQISLEFSATTQIFSETSDDFFANHDLYEELGGKTITLAFIDGLHYFEAALKDFINIEKHSSQDTVVLIHDCIPLNAATSKRDRETTFWSGDTWKIIPALKIFRPDLNVLTIPSPPTGLAVVTGLDSESTSLIDNFDAIVNEIITLDYKYLLQSKDEILNVIYEDWPIIQQRIRLSLS